jgi:signal transduction histidine kinase
MARSDDVLRVVVEDDGRGGARLDPDGGLAGIERRLAVFDGTLHVDSPAGGPTRITLVVPCGS